MTVSHFVSIFTSNPLPNETDTDIISHYDPIIHVPLVVLETSVCKTRESTLPLLNVRIFSFDANMEIVFSRSDAIIPCLFSPNNQFSKCINQKPLHAKKSPTRSSRRHSTRSLPTFRSGSTVKWTQTASGGYATDGGEIVLVPGNKLAVMTFSSIDLCHQAFRFLDGLNPRETRAAWFFHRHWR